METSRRTFLSKSALLAGAVILPAVAISAGGPERAKNRILGWVQGYGKNVHISSQSDQGMDLEVKVSDVASMRHTLGDPRLGKVSVKEDVISFIYQDVRFTVRHILS